MFRFILMFVLIGWAEGDCPGEDTSLAPLPITRDENLPVCEAPYQKSNCTCPSSMFECACHEIGKCKSGKPVCVEMWKVNDNFNDCGDLSDEISNVCPDDKFRCDCIDTTCFGYSGCVYKTHKCNGRNNCEDWSDEVNCTCPANTFECACYKTSNCSNEVGCVWESLHCDGYKDCGDGSDEVNCTCPADTFECSCYRSRNCTPPFGSCIHTSLLCDGYNDCGDWSDEINCTCPEHLFECSCYKEHACTSELGSCITKSLQCDGYNHCGDWSDEINCTCPPGKFECTCFHSQNCTLPTTGCIPTFQHCDGINDCGDWSDEVNCTCPADTFECACYKTQNCTTGVGCISIFEKCDGFDFCGDGSDEVNCSCPAERFQCVCYDAQDCRQHNGCASEDELCNGINDCGDWSDEVNCTCPADKFECACVKLRQCIGMELSCIDRSLLCDGKSDCVDGSDETHFTCNCSGSYARCPCDHNNTQCPSTGRCIPFDWIGDNLIDCSDGSDEVCSINNITCQSCDEVAVTCPSEKQSRYLVHSRASFSCNIVVENTCSMDINNCSVDKVVCTTTTCTNDTGECGGVFFCEDQQLISRIEFCDGQNDREIGCEDGSDEVRQGFGFKCPGLSREGICVLPQTNVYDSVAQCSDSSDICFLNGQFRCFQCLDRKLIVSSKQVCDGVVDCFDMSDECLCANQTLCQDIRGDCPMNRMHCDGTAECVDQESVLCNTSVQCVNGINTKYCLLHTPVESECIADENLFKETFTTNTLCRLVMKKEFEEIKTYREDVNSIYPMWCDGSSYDLLGVKGEIFCPERFECFANGEINVGSNKTCDGIIDCDDGSDEFLELRNKTQYFCKTKGRISIDKSNVCDAIFDCDDKSDESRCRCENTRFYCTNGEPLSVEKRLVQNGIDECVNLSGDIFADVNEMIANPFYRGIFWVTGVLALGGNLFVFVTTTRDLRKANKDQNLFINTSIFILNLSVADLLMGVYILAIMIQATTFSGSYCLFDKEWRSSSLCTGLGALAVISSEASAFTMTAMTTFRLISAFKPFLMRNVSINVTLIAELFCWVLAILISTIPLLQITSQYFVADVWFSNNFYGTDFVSRENMSLLAQRISNAQPKNWYDVNVILKNAFPRNPIKGEFGYYGETSVCMPRFFATTSEFAWEYSTFLITLNFLMFIYMVVAYLLIYKQSNRMKGSRSTDVSSKMQKRITRLILTDFCCWIPICVMGFVSVGGVKMPGDAYVLSACLLLPVNSALNPLLYSKALEERLSKTKNWIVSKISSLLPPKLGVRQNSPAAGKNETRVVEVDQ